MFYGIKNNKPMYNLKDFTVWIVRVNLGKYNKTHIIENTDSSPCSQCIKCITDYGFGKIAFSNNDGSVTIMKASDYKTDHLSSIQKRSLKYCRL